MSSVGFTKSREGNIIDLACYESLDRTSDVEKITECIIAEILQPNSSITTAQQAARAIHLFQQLQVSSKKMAELIYAIAEKKLFADNLPKAIKRISRLVKDKYSVELAFHRCLNPENANHVMWYGIKMGHIALVERALQLGASPNYEKHRVTALVKALQYRQADIALLLFSKKAQVKVFRFAATPLSLAQSQKSQTQSCLEQFAPLDLGFTDEVLTLQLLALLFSIKVTLTVEGETFTTERHYLEMVFCEYLAAAEPFFRQLCWKIREGTADLPMIPFSDEVADEVIHSLRVVWNTMQSCQDHRALTARELIDRLDRGIPVAMYGSCLTDGKGSSHAWSLLITPDEQGKYRVYRCNRGFGSEANSGVLIGLCEKEIVEWLIERFKIMNQHEKKYSSDDLKAIDMALLQSSYTYLLKRDPQTMGDCSVLSLTSLLSASLFDTFRKKYGAMIAEQLTSAVEGQLTSFWQRSILERYHEAFAEDGWHRGLLLLAEIFKRDMLLPGQKEIYALLVKFLQKQWNSPQHVHRQNVIMTALGIRENHAKWLFEGDDQRINPRELSQEVSYAIQVKKLDYFLFLLHQLEGATLAEKNKAIGKLAWLSMAIKSGAADIVDYLIRNGIDSDSSVIRPLLIEACAVPNNLQTIKALLNLKVDLHAVADRGSNALWYLVEKGYNLDAIRLLIDSGVRLEMVDKYGYSLLNFAAEKGVSSEVFTYLLDAAQSQASSSQSSAVDVQALDAMTPLMSAAYRGHKHIVDLLIQRGADRNKRNAGGMQAWMQALFYGQLDMVQHLLGENPTLDLTDPAITKIWFETYKNGSIEWLVEHGFDINVKNADGQTLIMQRAYEAPARDNSWAIKVLLEHPALQIDIQDHLGNTLLMIAILKYTHHEIVKKLLTLRPNLSLNNREGDTALDLAKKQGMTRICDMLQQYTST